MVGMDVSDLHELSEDGSESGKAENDEDSQNAGVSGEKPEKPKPAPKKWFDTDKSIQSALRSWKVKVEGVRTALLTCLEQLKTSLSSCAIGERLRL